MMLSSCIRVLQHYAISSECVRRAGHIVVGHLGPACSPSSPWIEYRRLSDGGHARMMQFNIAAKRMEFVRAVRRYREEGRPVVYSDETYIESPNNQAILRGVTDLRTRRRMRRLLKGHRLILVHAGGEQGFIPNAMLLHRPGKDHAEYKKGLNAMNYTNWVEKQLLPNLKPNSVVVIDNAPCHNMPIKRNSISNSVPALNEAREHQELSNRNCLRYVVDGMVRDHGHTILRLPPYHSELNPIELIWPISKCYVAASRRKDASRVLKQVFAAKGGYLWTWACGQVQQVEERYIEDTDSDSS